MQRHWETTATRQKEVWNGRLLPAILTCSPDTQALVEGRDKLVQALHEKGKVPAPLYSRYRAGTLFDKENKGDPVENKEEHVKNDNLEKLETILGDVELLKDCELRKVVEKAKHLVRKLRDQEIGKERAGGLHKNQENPHASSEHLTSLTQYNS